MYYFIRHRNEAAMEKTVVQVRNQSPFRFKSRNFVCARSANRLQVFELFSSRHKDRGKRKSDFGNAVYGLIFTIGHSCYSSYIGTLELKYHHLT